MYIVDSHIKTGCKIAAAFVLGAAANELYRSMSCIDVSEFKITSKLLPKSFDGFKIVQLTDLHNRVFPDGNAELSDIIADEKPDIIVMTGDMISHNAPHTREYLQLVKALCSIAPVYYVNGNHEMADLSFEEHENVRLDMEKSGAVCTDNKCAAIIRGADKINLCGLCYARKYYRGVRKDWDDFTLSDMNGYLGKKEKEVFTVLLAHNPLDFETYANWGADLTFSGHIHGGMLRLPLIGGIISPERRLMPKYKEGIYGIDGKYLAVSRGLGSLRINNPPEVLSVVCCCEE